MRRVAAASGVITTVAGTGVRGFGGDGGPAVDAHLSWPIGVAVAADGAVLVADTHNHLIRRVDGATGQTSSIAGTGSPSFAGDGGAATSARLDAPTGLALDGAHNLYIVDANNQRLRRVDASSGVITTLAGNGEGDTAGDDGPAVSASLNYPRGVARDAEGNLFVSEALGHRIRRIDGSAGTVSTVAGTGVDGSSGDGGPALEATLSAPSALALDGHGRLNIVTGARIRERAAVRGPCRRC